MNPSQFTLKALFGLTLFVALGCLVFPRVGTPAFWTISVLSWLAVAVAAIIGANSGDDRAR